MSVRETTTNWREQLVCQISHAETPHKASDLAADFVIRVLAEALGCDDWHASDGSETWEGDVIGTVYNVLRAARVLHPETDEVARHAE